MLTGHLNPHRELRTESASGLARPFVKWVGGKSQLLGEIEPRIPDKFKNYIEPFVGGGAVFFSQISSSATLIDINPELVNAYTVIRDDVDALIRDLKRHVNTEEYFYKIRDVDRTSSFKKWSEVRRASRLIYLNKTCFNGLYRVNSKGHFNTPFGKYSNPNFVDENNLRACSHALRNVRIIEGSFLMTEEVARKGDFVYFDPPYAPVSNTAYFTSYSKEGFANEMQEALRELCIKLHKKGVKFMLSNANVPLVQELYADRFNIDIVYASRAINSVGSKRGKVEEVLITNY